MLKFYLCIQIVKNYLDIVDGLAEQYGLMMERNELHQKALTWEIRHGGFSEELPNNLLMQC